MEMKDDVDEESVDLMLLILMVHLVIVLNIGTIRG